MFFKMEFSLYVSIYNILKIMIYLGRRLSQNLSLQ